MKKLNKPRKYRTNCVEFYADGEISINIGMSNYTDRQGPGTYYNKARQDANKSDTSSTPSFQQYLEDAMRKQALKN